jgi:hypothetical protein
MTNEHGLNGSVNGNGAAKAAPAETAPQAPISATGDANAGAIEYYILCPQRATDVPGLITHLISRDICEKRQTENYHKCPNCVRSRVWRERAGLPVEASAAAH